MQHYQQLTQKQARRLALSGQEILSADTARGLKGVLSAIEQLGYVQIDTISVVERAHHHTLWNRVPFYRQHYLDKLIEGRQIFEYWSHAAAYLPIKNFRYSLPRMHAIRSGQRHWYDKNQKTMQYVLDRVKSDGPLQAKDFTEHRGFQGGMWQWGPIKEAIEYLFMQGDLLVTKRHSFQKVFDLAQRIIPANIDTSTPSNSEYAHFLVDQHLQAHGIGQLGEFGYLRAGMGPSIKKAVEEKLEAKEMFEVRINRRPEAFYVHPDFEQLLTKRIGISKTKILSPFDNLVIQRKRLVKLFDFDYQLECYLPAPKRQHGYFCLPILWRGNLVARMDAKADRKSGIFHVHCLHLKEKLKNIDLFSECFTKELTQFSSFNGCHQIHLNQKINTTIRELINKNINL